MRMRIATTVGLAWALAVGATAAAQDGLLKVSGRVVGADGKPAAGVQVATFWIVEEKGGQQVPYNGASTDSEGRFTTRINSYGRDSALMAMNADLTAGGTVLIPAKGDSSAVEIRLGPVVHVRGTFASKELGHAPAWTNVYLNLMPGKVRLVQNSSRKADFSMRVPVGQYQMHAYGQDVQDENRTLSLTADQPDRDLGAVELPATILARHKGKELPPWSIVDARGAKKDVTLADYRGKWVLVDVWGYWCGPCVQQLAELIDFYDDHAEHRDKFEVIALHDGSVKDFEEMDSKNEATKKSLWHGRDLPFPVLLDAPNGARGKTVMDYGIRAFPTSILFDPDGKLVGEVSIEALEEKLPKIPLALRVSRALDRDVSLGVNGGPLNRSLDFLAQIARVPIQMDADSMKAAGVAPDVKGTLTLSGSVSLRSWMELLLDPLGLEAVPREDGILVTTRKADSAPREPSKTQKDCAARIEEKLARKVSFDFKGASLADVVQHFENQTQENFVLDPAGRKSGSIDPEATVTGSAQDVPLREAVEALLKPLGMKLVVKDEVVVIALPAP